MKRNFFYGYIILIVIFFIQIVMFGSQVSFGVYIKPITNEFGWATALVAGTFSAFSLVQSFSCMLMGWLNDRIGPRLVMTICGVLVGTGLMLMYLVQSTWQMYLFYVALAGIGAGGILAPQISTVARWFVRRRNLATAILFLGGGVGGFIGPSLITWLVYTYSWRQAFLVVGIATFIVVVLGAQFLRRDPSTMGQLPDGDKSGTEIKNTGPSEASGLTLKEAFKTRRFWFLSIAMFCIGFTLWTVFVHIVPYAIDKGVSPETSALILSVMSISQPAGSLLVSTITGRLGNGRSLVVCMFLLLAVAFLILPISNPWLLGLIVILLALGLGGTSVLQSSMTAELFGMKEHGAILGFSIFTFSLGSASGTYMAGLVYDATGSYEVAFSICSILIVVGIILAITLVRIKKTAAAV